MQIKLKNILYIFCSVTLLLTLSFIYLNSKNKETPEQSPYRLAAYEDELIYSIYNFEEVLLSQDGTFYLWFCDTKDQSCEYIQSEYINPLLKQLGVESFENLHKVEFDSNQYSFDKLRSKFNVKSNLAFINANVEDGTITYTNPLTWDEDKPFTDAQFKQWLYDSEIWQETYKSITTP